MLAHKGIQTPKQMASGGIVTSYTLGGSRYASHTFLSSGNFIVYNKALTNSELLENYNHGRLRILGIK